MKMDCDVIRDLLPLYADDACSDKSRALVEEHLSECAACRETLERMRATELESGMKHERSTVLEYAARRFRRRSAGLGALGAALITIPLVLILTKGLLNSMASDWYYIVLAALGMLASVIAVPILVPEDKLVWTFCAFTASLMVMLFVVCVYVRGSWFWVASSATLFGLGAAFLPALVHARPVKRLIGNANKALIVLGIDAALFLNMLNMIRAEGRLTLNTLLFSLLLLGGVGLVIVGVVKKQKRGK